MDKNEDKNFDFLPVFPDSILSNKEKLNKAIQILEKSISEGITYSEIEIKEIWERQEGKLEKVLKPFMSYVREKILSSKESESVNVLFEKIKTRLRAKLKRLENKLLKDYEEKIEGREE